MAQTSNTTSTSKKKKKGAKARLSTDARASQTLTVDKSWLSPSPFYLSRWLFLRGLGLIYLVAFASLYVQLKGTLGHNGIMPIDSHMNLLKQKEGAGVYLSHPSLLWYMTEHLPLTHDGASHLICLIGMAVSAIVLLGAALSPLLAVAWVCYLSLFSVGQNFLHFQWDILLLEAGFLSIIMAPLWSTKRYFKDVPPSLVTNWMMRWLLFRLMFASGAVKLSSECPTWWGLTALHYHYETQCLPLPSAWYAHHLPDAIQRLSVALTFVIEILVPLWMFLPHRIISIGVAFIQIFLQVLIIITGNYNFFNYLTILLCVPLLDDRFLSTFFPSWSNSNSSQATRTIGAKLWDALGYLLLLGCVGVTCWISFLSLRIDWHLARSLHAWLTPPDLNNSKPMFALAFNTQQWDTFVHKTIPYSLVAGGAMLALAALSSLLQAIHHALSAPPTQHFSPNSTEQEKKKKDKKKKPNQPLQQLPRNRRSISTYAVYLPWNVAKVLVILAVASAIFAASTVPFSNLAQDTQRALPPMFIKTFVASQSFHPVSGYGLFARMTTSRPEIIIEGSNDSTKWLPYEFKYKAGGLHRPPPVVAPHQPRLDWQMWFASLGQYKNNPWFVNLVAKLLTNNEDVIALLESNPFPHTPPRVIRAQLYEYHFTKPTNGSLWSEIQDSLTKQMQILSPSVTASKPWWTRKLQSDYLPVLGLPNPSLDTFLANFGWVLRPEPLTLKSNAERWLLHAFYDTVLPYMSWIVILFGVLALFI